MTFPENFVWGAASSACQIEGHPTADGGGISVWDTFCTGEGNIFENETCQLACDAYHRYEEDIALLAGMGLGAYRFSISWARVDPLGDGTWNEAGLAYYDRVVDACLARGVEPYITLHHWELPQTLQDRCGGWRSRETPEAFARFAGKIAGHFHGRVHRYITLNEMQCILNLGHHLGIHAPGLNLSAADVFVCWKNLLLAHGLALRAIKALDSRIEVGFASTGRLCYPESPEDAECAYEETFALRKDDWLFTHSMALDPICLGTFPAPPGSALAHLAADISAEEWSLIHTPPDFLGVNIYNGHAVRQGEHGEAVYIARHAGFPRTALKWPVTEDVMRAGTLFLHRRYGLPIYISENGLSCNDKIFLDGQVHDPDRIDFLARYLLALRDAAEDADVRGYFHWSLTDNFEWHSGYAERFGLIFVDYSTQRRIPKDSSRWFETVVRSNGAALDDMLSGKP